MKINKSAPGLYIVATPIGNLQDMTFRAVETLQTVDLIAAEDTRHSAALLQHFSIQTPMLALHEHNEQEKTKALIALLLQGKAIALISDAGTPLISDPGYFLVRAVRAAGIVVTPIPGVSALITALSVAGLATNKFCFEGFLPVKAKARLECLHALQTEQRTIIFYEAPHRIVNLLALLKEVMGNEREVVVARELTKRFETIKSGTLEDVNTWLNQDTNQQRGEFVVLLAGSAKSVIAEDGKLEPMLEILLHELPLKQAVDLAEKITGGKKNQLYQQALKLKASK